jgi:hypothetical protein
MCSFWLRKLFVVARILGVTCSTEAVKKVKKRTVIVYIVILKKKATLPFA